MSTVQALLAFVAAVAAAVHSGGASVALFSFLLAVIHVVLGLLWFGVLIAATVPMARLLRRPRVIRVMDRMTGVVFIGFAAKLALAR
jgi:threonine/homoserine/homoserine lactone efflux protein